MAEQAVEANGTSNTTTNSNTPAPSGTATPVPEYVYEEPVVPPQLAGHPGYLTPAQSEALETFRALLVAEGLYRPASTPSSASKEENAAASHDEATLLRFLRARSFQPPAALTQFKRAEEWRKEQDVEALFAGFSDEELDDARRFYPRWTGRRDKQGLPLFVYGVSELEAIQKQLEAVPPKRRYQRIIVLYELMVRFTLTLCSHLPHPSSPHPVSATTSIVDLGNASFTSLFRLRGHFQEASRLATPYYPETLGSIIIVNCPSFFPTVWGWIKGWFDEGTRHKIHVLGKDNIASTMLDLVHAQDLPKMYGGELDWTVRDPPSLDEHARAVLPDGKIPDGPIVFQDGKVQKPSLATTPAPTS